MKIKVLKAFNGDCILISSIDNDNIYRNILFDGGIGKTYLNPKDEKGKRSYGELKEVIDYLEDSGQQIDLLILTHIDDDHIGGILKWFQEDKKAYKFIKEVWFNSGSLIAEWLNVSKNDELEIIFDDDDSEKTSVLQGKNFEEYITEHKIWFRNIVLQGQILERHGLEFRILSPNKFKLEKLLIEWRKKVPDLKTATKEHDYHISILQHIEKDLFEEDAAVANGSSIAFILTWKKKNFLFLGDAHPSVVVEGLKMLKYSADNKLDCELVKISHHGSAGNTSIELLNCLKCDNYVISTDGNGHQHPHKQMLARLIRENPHCNIWFTYKERMDMIFSEEDGKSHKFEIQEIKKDFNF